MADFIVTLLFIGPIVVVGLIALVISMHKRTFKHRCYIAIPVGEAANDVIWTPDTFKTRNKEGHTEILFYRNRGKVYAPEYRFWGKWLKKSAHIPVTRATDSNPYADYGVTAPEAPKNTEGWVKMDDANLRNAIIRGAFFYKASETEYKVMKVSTDGKFNVLDSDSVQFVIDDIEDQKNLTTSFRDKLIALGTWLGSLLIIALLAIVIIVLTFKYTGEQSLNIVNAAKAAAAAAANVGG